MGLGWGGGGTLLTAPSRAANAQASYPAEGTTASQTPRKGSGTLMPGPGCAPSSYVEASNMPGRACPSHSARPGRQNSLPALPRREPLCRLPMPAQGRRGEDLWEGGNYCGSGLSACLPPRTA